MRTLVKNWYCNQELFLEQKLPRKWAKAIDVTASHRIRKKEYIFFFEQKRAVVTHCIMYQLRAVLDKI
jgi:hypothetical protein